MDNNINFFIKDKLDILDKSKSKYKDFINTKEVIFKKDEEIEEVKYMTDKFHFTQ